MKSPVHELDEELNQGHRKFEEKITVVSVIFVGRNASEKRQNCRSHLCILLEEILKPFLFLAVFVSSLNFQKSCWSLRR
jgi:hypothetical protein